MKDSSELLRNVDDEPDECVVRLMRSYWRDRDGVYSKTSLRYLKRKCSGYNLLDEDCANIGCDEIWPHITNLDKCKDGVYKVQICNEKTDWETGYIDEYDYKLVPYKEDRLLETTK